MCGERDLHCRTLIASGIWSTLSKSLYSSKNGSRRWYLSCRTMFKARSVFWAAPSIRTLSKCGAHCRRPQSAFKSPSRSTLKRKLPVPKDRTYIRWFEWWAIFLCCESDVRTATFVEFSVWKWWQSRENATRDGLCAKSPPSAYPWWRGKYVGAALVLIAISTTVSSMSGSTEPWAIGMFVKTAGLHFCPGKNVFFRSSSDSSEASTLKDVMMTYLRRSLIILSPMYRSKTFRRVDDE